MSHRDYEVVETLIEKQPSSKPFSTDNRKECGHCGGGVRRDTWYSRADLGDQI